MKFSTIIKAEQHQLKNLLKSELKYQGYHPISKQGFLYAEGEVPILLVAHMDTVHVKPVSQIFYSEDNDIMMAREGIGGDDRCGIFIIMELIRETKCHVLFCEDEEVGGIGAKKFCASNIKPDVKFMIEFDRKGADDSVYYDCGNYEFQKFIDSYGFEESYGTFSDISILGPYFDIAAVNLSSGYYNAHTKEEYIVKSDVWKTIERARRIIRTKDLKSYDYQEIQWSYSAGLYGKNYRGAYGYDYDDWGYYGGYDHDNKNNKGAFHGKDAPWSEYGEDWYKGYEMMKAVPLSSGEWATTIDGEFLCDEDDLWLGADGKGYILDYDNDFLLFIADQVFTENGLPRRWTEEDDVEGIYGYIDNYVEYGLKDKAEEGKVLCLPTKS